MRALDVRSNGALPYMLMENARPCDMVSNRLNNNYPRVIYSIIIPTHSVPKYKSF